MKKKYKRMYKRKSEICMTKKTIKRNIADTIQGKGELGAEKGKGGGREVRGEGE